MATSSLHRWEHRRGLVEWKERLAAVQALPDGSGERWAAYLLGQMYPKFLVRKHFTDIIPGAPDVLELFQGGQWMRTIVPPRAPEPELVVSSVVSPGVPQALMEAEEEVLEDEGLSVPLPSRPAAPTPVQALPAASQPRPASSAPRQDPRDAVAHAMLGLAIKDLQVAQASVGTGQPVESPFKPRTTGEALSLLRYLSQREQEIRDNAPPVTAEADPEAELDGIRIRRAMETGDERLILAAVEEEAEEVAFLARRLRGEEPTFVPGQFEVVNGGRRL